MVAAEDMLLTKDEMRAKYADKGSPDYQSHEHGCGCSGCYASWVEWRGANAVVDKLQVRRLRDVAQECAVSEDNPDTCGVCGFHLSECDESMHLRGAVTERSCPGARLREILSPQRHDERKE